MSFLEAIDIATTFMKQVTIPVYEYNISLWDMFWFVVVLSFAIWFIKKFFLG